MRQAFNFVACLLVMETIMRPKFTSEPVIAVIQIQIGLSASKKHDSVVKEGRFRVFTGSRQFSTIYQR